MRKNNLKIFVVLFSLLVGTGMSAQNSLWTKAHETETQSHELQLRNGMPTEYDIFKLDTPALKSILAGAPERFTGHSNVIVSLPTHEGELQNFRVYEASNFETELQEKHPGIRSYAAQGIEDPTATARFSVSDYTGVHVVIRSGNYPMVYIDPYTKDNNFYIVYTGTKIERTSDGFTCLVEDAANRSGFEEDVDYSPENANDGTLRTFRLALACTRQYANFHLNLQGVPTTATDAEKKAAVLSAMNDAMTRVNEIYNRDVAIHMNIIANNEDLIFLTPATDPYTNHDGFAMLGQNQATCDSVIGSENYDIGHVFSTGGGGVAMLRSPCVTNMKARGVTGLPQPINDPFYVDYVSHEMGHQYGANHTFNNACSGNRNPSTAVEPGSGSTILSYAGICPPNVSHRSDPYFHARSIAEIWSNIRYGTGQCGEQSNTNNEPPVADAGPNKTIPKSTPFILEGTATDPDDPTGESLTYTWEQMDPQVAPMPPRATNTQGPMFRTFESTSESHRYMPMIQTVIQGNTQSTWEVVPSVGRTMNFAFTVRDNHVGGGSTAHANKRITVDGDSGPFKVTSQSEAETWVIGTMATVTWDVAGTDGGNVNATHVDIFFSTDGGLTYPITIGSGYPNNGSAEFYVPSVNTNKGRVMVRAADNIFYSINTKHISVTGNVGVNDFSLENFTVFPNPSEGNFSVKFNIESSDMVSISLYDLRGRLIDQNTFNNISSSIFQHTMDYSAIQSGVYFIVVENGGKKATKKLIKK